MQTEVEKMIKAVIFDCFGVLYTDTFWTVVRTHMHDFPPPEREHTEQGLHTLLRQVDLGLLDRNTFWDQTAAALGMSRLALDQEVDKIGKLDNDVMKYITELKSRGFKIGFVSNVGHDFIGRVFAGYDVAEFFDDMVLSSDVGLIKPDPRIYRLAAHRLKLSPTECVFIDDSPTNVSGAIDIGMQSIEYKGLKHCREKLEPLLSNANN